MKLDNYLETVLEQYKDLDLAHDTTHIREVLKYAKKISSKFKNINQDMIKAAVVYHDLGMKKDRVSHHITSAKMVLEDNNLKLWFNEEQIKQISQACLNHRSSNPDKDNLSILDKIVNDADSCDGIYTDRMLERAFCFNYFKSDNTLSIEEICENAYEHLNNKYGEGGYSNKFLLKETYEVIKGDLDERANLLKNKEAFMEKINKIIPNLLLIKKE